MPTVESSGTQTATVGTEHTLATITTSRTLILRVKTNNLADGATPDIVELKVYAKVLTGDTTPPDATVLAYAATYVGKQAETVKCSIPITSPFSAAFTLKQTQGTGRAFAWSVESI